MKGFQNLIGLVQIAAFSIPLATSLTVLIMQVRGGSRWRLALIAASLGTALLCLWLVYGVVAEIPAFDWIDWCRPAGTGFCLDGQPLDTVEAQAQRAIAIAFGLYSIAVAVIAAGAASLLRRLL